MDGDLILFNAFAGTVMTVGPAIMWAKAIIVWRALRADNIPALRVLLFASICRALAITLLALVVWDNILDLKYIEGSASRVASVVMVLLVIAPAARFLWAYFNHGFRRDATHHD